MELLLGNVAPVEVITKDTAKARGLKLGDLDRHDDEKVRVRHDLEPDEEHRVTHVVFPDSVTLAEAFTNLTHNEGVWRYHSDEAPVWVSSDVPALAQLVQSHFTSGPYDGQDVKVVGWDSAPTVVRSDGEEG